MCDGQQSPTTAFRDEKSVSPAVRTEAITLLGVLPKRRARGVRDGHKARFSEFGLPHRAATVFKIDIVSVERQRFAWSEAGSGKQPHAGGIRQSPQSSW